MSSDKLLPPPPLPQGQNSKTFKFPPVDGSLTIAEVFDFHAKESSEHPFWLYEDEPGKLVTIPWPRLVHATSRVAHIVQGYNIPTEAPATKIVAILALVDTISYFTLIHGIIRSGYIPFPISPRNSPAAIAHLLIKTNTTHMFVSSDPSMQGLSTGALKMLAADKSTELQVERLPVPFFDELYAPIDEKETFIEAKHPSLKDTALVLHSSGSTSFPKPIYITHRIMIEWLRIPTYGEVDMAGMIIGAVALPMFHALGVINSIASVVSGGGTLAVFKPVERPAFPTPDKVLAGLEATKADITFALPVFLEAWSQSPETIEPLKRMTAVIFSGGPLSKVVGDILAEHDVKLMQVYGITEVGAANIFIPKEIVPKDWEYFKFGAQHKVHLAPQEDGQSFEFQLTACETHTPAVFNTKIDGVDGYSTSDLVIEHPEKKGYWKIHGRVDDQIMLSTGEKTNPGPLEAIISKDSHIAGAVMFGRGKPQNGIIVEPAPGQKVDLNDKASVNAYLDAIWSAVETANKYAPSHSRLIRALVIIAKPEKPFTFTGKGSIRKSAVVKDYAEEIDAAYDALESASSVDVPAPEKWTKETTFEFVKAVIGKVLEEKVTDDDDIFQHGGDSLQATLIRNSIGNAVKEAGYDISGVSANFVYENPTIAELALATYAIIDPSSDAASSKLERKVAEIEKLIETYSANFPKHKATASKPEKESVLVTGTTGGLGTTMLAQLVEKNEVSKIYALNRKGSKSLKERQEESLVERGYDRAIASSPKVVFIEGDSSVAGLGIAKELHDEILANVTSIFHTAWRVDFNLSVSSFDPLFKGLRNLIDLALSSPLPEPPRLLFAGSVSIFSNWHSKEPAVEGPIEDPKVVVGSGYGESKWVAERVLANAAKETPLKPVVVRIGQLSGGTNGSWNASEWVPSVVRSGEVVRALPSSELGISWLPLAAAAASIIDFRKAEAQTFHLAHPRSVSWNSIFGPIAEALGVPLVPYADWLAKLEADLSDPSRDEVEAAKANPALRLIDMFRPYQDGAFGDEAREAMGVPILGTTEAVKASKALSEEELPPLGKKDALGWVKYWKKVGLLKTEELKLDDA